MAALANVSEIALAQRVIDAIIPCLLVRLNNERDSEIMYTVAEALSEQARLSYESLTDGAAVSASPPSGSPGGPGISAPTASKSDATPHTTCTISLAGAAEVFKAVQAAMHDSIDRRVQSAKLIAANPDSDADDAEVLRDELAAEDDFMVNLVDTTGYVVKQHGAAIMPLVGETIGKYLLPHLATKDALRWPIRHAAICLCDDLVEFASPVAHALLPVMLPAILDVLTTPGGEATLRQAAAYGAAVCAQHGGDAVTPHAKALVDALIACVTAPGAREDDAENATDNAVSALLRFALYRRSAPGIDADSIMAGVVAYLPIKADGIEARTIHGRVIDAIASMDETWLGKGMSRLPAVLKGLADGLVQHHLNTDSGAAGAAEEDEDGTSGEELFDEAALERFRLVLKGVKASPYAAAFSGIVGGLSKKQQAAIAHYDTA